MLELVELVELVEHVELDGLDPTLAVVEVLSLNGFPVTLFSATTDSEDI
jgi:hypothetical protein